MSCSGCQFNGDCEACKKALKAEKNPEKEKRNKLIKIIVSAVLFAAVFVVDKIVGLHTINPGSAAWVLPFVCYFIVYFILGREVVSEAFEGIKNGEVFDENFLMTIASLGAFALGIYSGCLGDAPDGFAEGCAVVILNSIGEYFEDWAGDKSKDSIAELMNIRPEKARLVSGKEISPEDVKIDDVILVKKGERVPLDGVLICGSARLDMMALTGESEIVDIDEEDEVLSGAINFGSEIQIRVTKIYENSTVSRILNLVENESGKKTKAENFITKFARVYTPIVVFLALALAIIPPVFGLVFGNNGSLDWNIWIYRALCFLVISCPCALVVSVPLTFFMGIGKAGKNRILVKGSQYLELINQANIFVCDKTGTLTEGRARLKEFEEKGNLEALVTKDELKAETPDVVAALKSWGARIIMLSGDKEEVAADIAAQAGITEYEARLLPEDKVKILEKIMNEKQPGDVVCYMGDGINDAPSLMRSDVGISMGSIGSDAAVEASDIVLMTDDLRGIPLIKKIAARTMLVARENVIFPLAIKLAVLVLTAFGFTNMWIAVFSDVGVCILAILNALKIGLMRFDK